MKDHKKLRAFELADELAVLVYELTRKFPREELFGLTSQMRRSAVSVASNIVEGCGRHTKSDYLHFLDMAYGSSNELQYQVSLAERLSFLPSTDFEKVRLICEETSKVLNGLLRSLRKDDNLEP